MLQKDTADNEKQQKVQQLLQTHTSLTMNLSIFENLLVAGSPSGFSKATKVCPGES
jgi:hypothetical protein